MFHIKTFINVPNQIISDLSLVQKNPDVYFIEVGEKQKLLNISKLLDFNYLNGAIFLEYDGNVLMDYKMWDLVDQLWAYILNLIEEYLDKNEGYFYFPDQPLKVEMKGISKDWVLFKIGEGEYTNITLPRFDFIHSLLSGAERFFLCMTENFGTQCDYSHEIMIIDRLNKII